MMFSKLLRGPKKEGNPSTTLDKHKDLLRPPKKEENPSPTLDKHKEALEMLEKKEKAYQKKIQEEAEKAKEFVRARNEKAATHCLKRKKLYETKIEEFGESHLAIDAQMIMLEAAEARTQAVAALRTGVSAMKSLQEEANIDAVDKIMDEINELTEKMKQVQDTFQTFSAADFDQDELDADLEKLKGELEEQQPAVTAPATRYIRAGRGTTRRTPPSSLSSSTESGTTTC